MWKKRTSAKTTPYLKAVSTALSVDPLISGEYPFNNFSSSSSDESRDPLYAKNISRLGWAVAKRRTVVLAENRNSRDQRY